MIVPHGVLSLQQLIVVVSRNGTQAFIQIAIRSLLLIWLNCPRPAALGTVGTFAEDFWFRSGFLPTTSVPDIPKQKKEILEITTMETILKSNLNNILNFNGYTTAKTSKLASTL